MLNTIITINYKFENRTMYRFSAANVREHESCLQVLGKAVSLSHQTSNFPDINFWSRSSSCKLLGHLIFGVRSVFQTVRRHHVGTRQSFSSSPSRTYCVRTRGRDAGYVCQQRCNASSNNFSMLDIITIIIPSLILRPVRLGHVSLSPGSGQEKERHAC